jgi:hypothetical protein
MGHDVARHHRGCLTVGHVLDPCPGNEPNRMTRTRGIVPDTARGTSASVDTSIAVQLTYRIQLSGVAVPVTAIPLPGSAPMPTVRTPGRPRSAP